MADERLLEKLGKDKMWIFHLRFRIPCSRLYALGRYFIHLKSDIEKNLKFTIEQNIVEINRLKALVDEANNKQKQEQFASVGLFGRFLNDFNNEHNLCSLEWFLLSRDWMKYSYSILNVELIKKYQTERDSKQIKIDELELRLGLSEIR